MNTGIISSHKSTDISLGSNMVCNDNFTFLLQLSHAIISTNDNLHLGQSNYTNFSADTYHTIFQ